MKSHLTGHAADGAMDGCPPRLMPDVGWTTTGPMIDDEMVAAWREAASRLGVRVVAPHVLRLKDGESVAVEAFLPDFGRPGGTIAVALDDQERCRLAGAGVDKLFVSQLSPTYRCFDPDLFRGTLDDWGWFGSSDDRPAWYTGKPWP